MIDKKNKDYKVSKRKRKQQYIVIGLLVVTIAGTIIGSLQAIL